MTEKEIILKPKKALDKLGISYDSDYADIINYETILLENPLLLEMFEGDENYKNQYSVSFQLTLPNKMQNLISVVVDKKTHKFLYVFTKYKTYEIPKGFE